MRLGSHAKYRSAGTVEFLVDDDTSKFYFLEVHLGSGLWALCLGVTPLRWASLLEGRSTEGLGVSLNPTTE